MFSMFADTHISCCSHTFYCCSLCPKDAKGNKIFIYFKQLKLCTFLYILRLDGIVWNHGKFISIIDQKDFFFQWRQLGNTNTQVSWSLLFAHIVWVFVWLDTDENSDDCSHAAPTLQLSPALVFLPFFFFFFCCPRAPNCFC